MDIRTWSLARVIFASVLWVLLVIIAVNGYMFAVMAIDIWRDSRRAEPAGIGAVTVSFRPWLAAPVLIAPPVVLAIAWYVLRRG